MKVRLYRGPHDGKVVNLDNKEQVFVIESLADEKNLWVEPKASPVMAINTVKSYYVRTGHTHPDGSVFFEWDQPRGRRTGIKSKRKPRRASENAIFINASNAGWTSIATGASIRPLSLTP